MKIEMTCCCGSSIRLETTKDLEKVETCREAEAWQEKHSACLLRFNVSISCDVDVWELERRGIVPPVA